MSDVEKRVRRVGSDMGAREGPKSVERDEEGLGGMERGER